MAYKFIGYFIHSALKMSLSAVFVAGVIFTNKSYAEEGLWEILQQEGDVLELMAVTTLGDSILLVGARYEEQRFQSTDESGRVLATPILRKQLHLINIDRHENIRWQKSYPAFPDVSEIFSVSATPGDHLCIAYGRHYGNDEFFNPVLLQVEAGGKIVWANTAAIPSSTIQSNSRMLVQLANLDSINVVDSEDNGCALGYILRRQTVDNESLDVNLLLFDKKGQLQWHHSRETDLYGKMFIVRDESTSHYTIVQTNQSRDAAIEAMVAAQPFFPRTRISIVSSAGELLKTHENLESLSRVWIKHIIDAPGDQILMAGNAKTAWAGFIDSRGKVSGINKALEGEYSHIHMPDQNGYLLVRDDSLVSMGKLLKPRFNKQISKLIKKKYSNSYLENKLPEQVPIQNIVPLKNNNYLILYKLGSKLLKVELKD